MNRQLWAFVVGCGLLCACADDPTQGDGPRPIETRSITLRAVLPEGTRTQLAENGVGVLWSPGDRIGIYVRSGDALTTVNVPLTYTGTEAAAEGWFTGDITLTEGAADYTLYAYYPYSAQAGDDPAKVVFTLPTQQTQTAAGTSTQLGLTDFLAAQAATSATGDFGPLAFRHAFAVVEVDLTASGAMSGKRVESVMLFGTNASSVQSDGTLVDTANMTGDFTFDLTSADNRTAVYAGGSAQINYCGLHFADKPVLGTEPVKAYLTIAPADYSRGNGRIYFVVRTEDDFTATFSRPGLAIAAAQMKAVSEQLADGEAPQPALDLTAGGPTANCYVASRANRTYSFDATVAGNGVVTEGLRQAVQRFEGRTLTAAIEGATTARLMWQSIPYLIAPGSVAYAGGRVSFTLTERPTVLGGNAVIGLFASDDPAAEALWSWHIWITDRSNDELLAAAETYVLPEPYQTAYGPGATQLMDRNLGAIYKEAGAYARSFRAPLFQWGRKDPFPWGTVVFDARNVPHNYLTEWQPVQTTGSPGQYIGYTGNSFYATAHPMTFIKTVGQSSYDWYWGGGAGSTDAFRNNHLWGNPEGVTVGQTTTKTLFDPCPPGWKVPHPYAFSAFTRTGETADISSGDVHVSGSFVQGWNFIYNGVDTSYYPGVGYRYDEFGFFAFRPSGYYWSSSPAPSQYFHAWAFGLTPLRVEQRMLDPRGTGIAVRCQKE